MSRHEPTGQPGSPGPGRVRAYLTRFFTCWVAEDPTPTYSSLDLADGLGQESDPICQPRVQIPESLEVSGHHVVSDQHEMSDRHQESDQLDGRVGSAGVHR